MRTSVPWKRILVALANCVALVSGAAGQTPSVTEVPRIRAIRATEPQAGLTLRPNRSLLVDLTDTYNRVRLPQGNFSTNLLGGRVSYNFSRRFLTSAFVQLNSAAQLSSLNFRLRYIFRPYSDLFAIYNQTTGRGLERPSHQLQFKLTYYLQM